MRAASLALLVVAACGSTSSAPAGPCASYDAVFVGSDYTSSNVGGFALSGAVAATAGVDLGTDPVLAASQGRVFFVSRSNDALFELTPGCGTPLSKISVHDASFTRPTNPYDVAVGSDGALFVPSYNDAELLVLAGGATSKIDLSSFDRDGNPNASAAASVGGSVFIALERLDDADNYASTQPSWVLSIDANTRAIQGHVELQGRNPFGRFIEHGQALYLAEPGNFNSIVEPSAGVERFDPQSMTSKLVAHETDLGGSVAEIAITDRCAVAIVADATMVNATSLVTFDPDSGALLKSGILTTRGFDLEGAAWLKGGSVLAIGDRTRGDRGYAVHVFDRKGACDLVERTDAVALPLPPIAVF